MNKDYRLLGLEYHQYKTGNVNTVNSEVCAILQNRSEYEQYNTKHIHETL